MSENMLKLIPKYEDYTRYEIEMIIKIPKMAKYLIGNEYINNVVETLKDIYLIQKIDKKERLKVVNEIDGYFSYQRSMLRVMYKERYIDEKKFNVSMRCLKELGLMLGGYVKSLGIYNKESEKVKNEN